MPNSISFFATKRDLHGIWSTVESRRNLSYIEAGTFDEPNASIFNSASSIPQIGEALQGNQILERFYLVQDIVHDISFREIRLRSGGCRYAMDQQMNPYSIVFRPGGKFRDEAIIAGQLGTCSEEQMSVDLIKVFVSEIKKQFCRIKSFWVGEEAMQLLRSGLRLTVDIRASTEFDLVA